MKRSGLALVIIFVLSNTVIQQVCANGIPVWTNNGVAICNTTGPQRYPQLAGDGCGGAIITWSDGRGSDFDIYAQRVNGTGDPQWTPNGRIIYGGIASKYDPQVVGDGSGGAIITWEDYGSSKSEIYAQIYAQRVDAAGNHQWIGTGVVICDTTGWGTDPQIVGDGFGGAIITWMDQRNGNADIYAQRVDAAGNPQWASNGIAICDTINTQYRVQLVGDGFGGAIIVWEDLRPGSNGIYAQRVDAGGGLRWTLNGVAICDTTSWEANPQIVEDGFGGAIIVWEDSRSGSADIYAQRVDSAGSHQWAPNGVVICEYPCQQNVPQLVGDGFGGAIIVWEDERRSYGFYSDIYVQHVDAAGNALWIEDGVRISYTGNWQYDPQLVSDGFGGAIVAWVDSSLVDTDIYAQHVDAAGNPRWTLDGVAMCDTIHLQYGAQLVSDGFGGAIVVWEDERSLTSSDIYAQQVLDPVPHIVTITDVPEDQGRQVAVLWYRSGIDYEYYPLITEYSIWRAFPFGTKVEPEGREWDGKLLREAEETIYRKIERQNPGGEMKMEFWELIGTQDAHTLDGYSYIAPTLYDSSAGNPAHFSFFVSAHTSDPEVYYDSEPASGYSVDNIGPAKAQMTVLAAGGGSKGPVNTVWLAWDQVTTGVDGSPEQGPIEYRIYCHEAPDFSPGAGNLLTTVSGLSYPHTDSRIGDPAANLFYLVTAVDGSGNESAVSNMVGEIDRNLSSVK